LHTVGFAKRSTPIQNRCSPLLGSPLRSVLSSATLSSSDRRVDVQAIEVHELTLEAVRAGGDSACEGFFFPRGPSSAGAWQRTPRPIPCATRSGGKLPAKSLPRGGGARSPRAPGLAVVGSVGRCACLCGPGARRTGFQQVWLRSGARRLAPGTVPNRCRRLPRHQRFCRRSECLEQIFQALGKSPDLKWLRLRKSLGK
jgi:hypothetical protein